MRKTKLIFLSHFLIRVLCGNYYSSLLTMEGYCDCKDKNKIIFFLRSKFALDCISGEDKSLFFESKNCDDRDSIYVAMTGWAIYFADVMRMMIMIASTDNAQKRTLIQQIEIIHLDFSFSLWLLLFRSATKCQSELLLCVERGTVNVQGDIQRERDAQIFIPHAERVH